MRRSKSDRQPVVIEVFLKDTPKSKGRELRRRISEESPDLKVHSHYRERPRKSETRVHHYVAKMMAGADLTVRLVHEVYIFLRAHQVPNLLYGGVAREVVHNVWRTAKGWAKSGHDGGTYRLCLYGPDNKLIRAAVVKDGKFRKLSSSLRDRARRMGRKLRF
jgi:hypothetical protein